MKKLVLNLELGQLEDYLKHIKPFHYLVECHFKVIYFIDFEQNVIL